MRIVSQNILHGMTCADGPDHCDLTARLELFAQQLDDAGCPDIVGLQETNGEIVTHLRQLLPHVCDQRYELVTDGDPGLDRELTLTTGKVVGQRRLDLAGPLRTAQVVRIATKVGLVDFVTTHLASSADDRPCDRRTCPPPCQVDDMLNACQARQVVAFATRETDPAAVVVIAGDLNATSGEPTNRIIRDAGFVDTHLQAGNAECDPSTGKECTSGRKDDDLSDLTDPASKQTERIDFVYLGGKRSCAVRKPTGLFDAKPADGGLDGLVFPSDHTGVQATIACRTSDAQRRAAPQAADPGRATTTTTAATGAVDDAARRGIAEAYRGLFAGGPSTPDQRLHFLQDADLLRDAFLASYAATKDVNARITVRIDQVVVRDADHADVTYSLLLDDTPVLDHLPGQAIRIDGRWLVTRQTYCDVSTQGATEIPEPCR